MGILLEQLPAGCIDNVDILDLEQTVSMDAGTCGCDKAADKRCVGRNIDAISLSSNSAISVITERSIPLLSPRSNAR